MLLASWVSLGTAERMNHGTVGRHVTRGQMYEPFAQLHVRGRQLMKGDRRVQVMLGVNGMFHMNSRTGQAVSVVRVFVRPFGSWLQPVCSTIKSSRKSGCARIAGRSQ